jgi:hypothetical protein
MGMAGASSESAQELRSPTAAAARMNAAWPSMGPRRFSDPQNDIHRIRSIRTGQRGQEQMY